MRALAIVLASCSARDVAHHLLEDATNSDHGRNAASCNQIKNACNISNQNNPESYRHYSQWRNEDGSIGCTCSNK